MLRSTGSRVCRAQDLWLVGSGAQAQQLGLTGSAAPWHVGSSRSRDRTSVPLLCKVESYPLDHQGSPAFPLSGGRDVFGFGGGGSLLTPLPGSYQGIRCLHKRLPPSWSGLVPTNTPHGHLKLHPWHPHHVLSAFFIAASSLKPLVPFLPCPVEHRGLTTFSLTP